MRTLTALCVSGAVGIVAFLLIRLLHHDDGSTLPLRIVLCVGLAVMDLALGAGARIRAGRPLCSWMPPAFTDRDDHSRR